MTLVYIGLGTNLGERDENLKRACRLLDAAGVRILRASSIYETEPRDLTDQPWFLNQVIEAETELLPLKLLHSLLRIEREMGRRRLVSKGPRVIDLDLLLYGKSVIRTKELDIPHPRISERRFVLEPLAELDPDLRIPVRSGVSPQTVARLLDEVSAQKVRKRNATG